MKKLFKCLIVLLVCIVLSYLNEKYQLVVTTYEDMVEYQFHIFTISTVLAGFSFTSLGTLLGLSSESLMTKLKDTSIVINKSKRIVKTLICFCCSGVVSLFFIIGLDQLLKRVLLKINIIKWVNVLNFIFLSGIVFLVMGIIYFIFSVHEIYDLIVRVYGTNTKKYEKMEEDYKLSMQEALERDHEMRDDTEIDEFIED